MSNTLIPTLGRNPLYCVWVETGDKRQPLTRVWINPEHQGCSLASEEAGRVTRLR